MRITAHYRELDLKGDITKPGGINNPSGGVTSKIYHLREALPNIEIFSDFWDPGEVAIVEALWFDEQGEETMQQRIRDYRKSTAFKILWLSDVSPLRWKGEYREQIFDCTNIICTLSDYSQQLMEAYTDKTTILYDPIDIDMFVPAKKERTIFATGQISIEKNIQTLAKIFGAVPPEAALKKIYIGSRTLWGMDHHEDTSIELENRLRDATDVIESRLPRTEIAKRMAPLWGYVGDTFYDFSSYSMMEAMLCGCWLFTGRHLMYDERPAFRFRTPEQAVALILYQLENAPPEEGLINEEARQFIIDRNSYDNFRKQFLQIVGKVGFGL